MKIVYTVYPGADSESVDDLVTTPIEDKVGSLSGVKSITSSSMENVSMVLLQYDYDQNVNDAYLDLPAELLLAVLTLTSSLYSLLGSLLIRRCLIRCLFL